MVNAILGKKLGMTQIFNESGDALPATVQGRSLCSHPAQDAENDGYEAAQIGLVEFPPPKRLTQAEAGHFKKAGAPLPVFAGGAAVVRSRSGQGRGQGPGGPV